MAQDNAVGVGQPQMRSKDTARDALPGASDAEQASMPPAWRRKQRTDDG
jgi:hypothetical protein